MRRVGVNTAYYLCLVLFLFCPNYSIPNFFPIITGLGLEHY